MALVFNLVLHVLLIGTLLLFVGGIIAASVAEQDPRERILRIAALAVGAMVALGAEASGVSLATFTVGALAGARPASAAAQWGAAIIPALLGTGLGFYIVRVFKRSDLLAMRVLGFIAMLAATAFAEVYAKATQTNGVFLGVAAVPHIAFVSGIILTVVFTFDPGADTSSSNWNAVKGILGRTPLGRSGVPASQAFGQAMRERQAPGEDGSRFPARRHDPFKD